MSFDPEKIGNEIANVFTWLMALTAILFAAHAASFGPVLWFVVGYAAHRIMPKPAAPGRRSVAFLLIVLATLGASVVLASWGPLLWFAAGWIAFATTYTPPN